MDLSWMAWTKPTAIFFITIACFLVTLTVWELLIPGGAPRKGILRFETTRGDRLFISLLGSAYIHILWIAFTGLSLWWALGLSLVFALFIFMCV